VKLETPSMKVARTGPGRCVDDAAAHAAIFDGVGAGQHLKLSQCLDTQEEARGAPGRVGISIRDVHTIDHVVIHLRTDPVNRDSQTTATAGECRDRFAHVLELQDTRFQRR
jgi:hypothetical protein